MCCMLDVLVVVCIGVVETCNIHAYIHVSNYYPPILYIYYTSVNIILWSMYWSGRDLQQQRYTKHQADIFLTLSKMADIF